jgi:cytochrome c
LAHRPDQVRSGKDASADALNADSVTNTNVTAEDHLQQADTSITKIGTADAGGLLAPGAKLIAASTCTGCHKEKEKLVGPAYVDVAKRYPATEANIAMLTTKVIQGGKGHWGEVPMSPHPGLPEADAREMVKYVLSLK